MVANITDTLKQQAEKAAQYFKNKLDFTLGPVELKEKMASGEVNIIDVRKKEDYEAGHIPCALSIPKDELENRLDLLMKDKVNVVYCYTQQCHLGARVALMIASKGYPVMELDGGIQAWRDYGFEIEK